MQRSTYLRGLLNLILTDQNYEMKTSLLLLTSSVGYLEAERFSLLCSFREVLSFNYLLILINIGNR